MDTRNCIKAGSADLLAQLRDRNVVVGAKQLRKAIRDKRVTMVLLAKNADFALTESLEAICLDNHIPFAWVPNMVDLGHACGIDVGAVAAAVVDQ